MNLIDLMRDYPRATIQVLVIVLNWVAAVILLLAAWNHPRGALRERSTTALVMAVVLTMSFPLLLNVQLGFPWFDRDTLVWLGYIVTFLAGMPAVAWLVIYVKNGFGDGGTDDEH